MKRIQGIYSFKNDIGKVRVTNEDSCKVVTNSSGDVLMMVADGMGGHKKGDFASQSVINFLSEEFKNKSGFLNYRTARNWVILKIRQINEKLFDRQENDPLYKGMGTTLVLALLVKNHIVVINIGDSRCYFLKDGKLTKITEDHTIAQYLVNSHQMTPEEAKISDKRHILSNAMVCFPSISFDRHEFINNGETIFLCSDGLYNNVEEVDIQNALNTNDLPEIKLASLINLANFNGGSDNVSCCLWEPIKND